ncbi:MAG: tetratricopeptide repeat protein [Pseudomonadota bacterium]
MILRRLLALPLLLAVAACSESLPGTGGLGARGDALSAPGVDRRADAVSGIEVGHRLIAAGEYELALQAFSRAALAQGMDAEILSGMGSANLGLGRLNQAERNLRSATTDYEAWPEIWNNLGVVLMEQGKTPEAIQIFRKAFALDDGESTLIRDNLRLALAKSEQSGIEAVDNETYKLVRRGSSDYLISPTL